MNIRARHPIYMTKILHHIVSNIKTVFIMKMVWVFEKIICFSNHTKYVYIYMQWSNEFAKKQKEWHSFKHYTYCSNDKSKQTHMPDKKTCGILKFLLRRFALFFLTREILWGKVYWNFVWDRKDVVSVTESEKNT